MKDLYERIVRKDCQCDVQKVEVFRCRDFYLYLDEKWVIEKRKRLQNEM